MSLCHGFCLFFIHSFVPPFFVCFIILLFPCSEIPENVLLDNYWRVHVMNFNSRVPIFYFIFFLWLYSKPPAVLAAHTLFFEKKKKKKTRRKTRYVDRGGQTESGSAVNNFQSEIIPTRRKPDWRRPPADRTIKGATLSFPSPLEVRAVHIVLGKTNPCREVTTGEESWISSIVLRFCSSFQYQID